MEDQDKIVTSKWKKEYSLVIILNIVYILIFYILMQIYS
jgi:hypothetical protein